MLYHDVLLAKTPSTYRNTPSAIKGGSYSWAVLTRSGDVIRLKDNAKNAYLAVYEKVASKNGREGRLEILPVGSCVWQSVACCVQPVTRQSKSRVDLACSTL